MKRLNTMQKQSKKKINEEEMVLYYSGDIEEAEHFSMTKTGKDFEADEDPTECWEWDYCVAFPNPDCGKKTKYIDHVKAYNQLCRMFKAPDTDSDVMN